MYSGNAFICTKNKNPYHTHSLIAHVVHTSSLLRYPWFPVVCVHVDGPCVIDPDWASQEEIPACHWPTLLHVSTPLLDHRRHPSPPACRTADLREISDCQMELAGGGNELTAGFAKSQAGLPRVLCWRSPGLVDCPSSPHHACIHTPLSLSWESLWLKGSSPLQSKTSLSCGLCWIFALTAAQHSWTLHRGPSSPHGRLCT